MSDRGEYRTFFVAFADDVDVHALSGDAVKLLVLLKLSLPVTGIGVIYPSKLCDQVGCDRAHLEVILGELENPKVGRDQGWIQRDRNVVWILNGLAFENGLTPANKNHVKFVRRLIAQLDSHSKTVLAFRAAYHQWFHGDTKGISKGFVTPSGSITSELQANNKRIETQEKRAEISTEERTVGAAGSAPLADALAQLPKTALDFLRTFYPRGRAASARREDVAQQLLATLNGGAELKGQLIRAYSTARLVEKCREVIRTGVRDHDKAIVVLLTKLGDTSDDAAPGVQAAHETAAEATRDERDAAGEFERASAWLAEHSDAAAAIEERLELDGLGSDIDEGVLLASRNIARRSLVLDAWRTAGAPEAAHV